MLIALRGWLVAFFFTQLFEMPIYLRATRSFRVSFFASAMTHPIVWFVFPVLTTWGVPWVVVVVLAESFAILAEAYWLKVNGVQRALLWSFLANLFSVTCGFALREWTGIV